LIYDFACTVESDPGGIMKIFATFDETAFSEATIPILQRMAALPNAEFVLLAIGDVPAGKRAAEARRTVVAGSPAVVFERPQVSAAETKEQAVERRLAELQDYLAGLAHKLPDGQNVNIEAHLGADAAKTIIERAQAERPDVIVMATHGRPPVKQLLFGSTTEAVIRSGVAPVLVVHPTD
jgi:nucleotide-binding universal stress UspA family protein